MHVAGDIKQTLRRIFFWTPCSFSAKIQHGQVNNMIENFLGMSKELFEPHLC